MMMIIIQSITLVTEYLGGGELFERLLEADILEADCCHFIRQVRGLLS